MMWKFIRVNVSLTGFMLCLSCNSPDPPSCNIWAATGGGLGYAIPGPRPLQPLQRRSQPGATPCNKADVVEK